MKTTALSVLALCAALPAVAQDACTSVSLSDVGWTDITATTSAAKTGRTKAVAAPAKTPAKAVRATAAKKSAAASAPARRSSPKAGKKAAA